MSDLNWIKPVSVASVIAISVATLSFEKVAVLEKLFDDLAKSGAHGWAVLWLMFFALYIQWRAIGMPERTKSLIEAEQKLSKTNQLLIEQMNKWKTFVTASVRLQGSQANNENALAVLLWLAKDQGKLQEIADKYKEEIKKG